VHLGSLRAKLGDPSLIQTVRNAGYRLRVDPPRSDTSPA
jgi:DNA-binding response OmpR family regulator